MLIEHDGVNLEDMERVQVKAIYEFNEYTLHELSIRVANIPCPPWSRGVGQARDQQSSLPTPRNEDEAGPLTSAPPSS